ncbi:hypothetical protein VTI74DRAFT_8377 [Chaetomium olivicolor]
MWLTYRPEVWKLQLRKAEKIGVTLAFCLGFFVVFASAYRFTVLFSYNNADPTYTLAPTVGWTAIEMSAGIISACLPTLGPAMAVFFRVMGIKRALFSSRGGAGTNLSSSKNLASSNLHVRSGPGSVSDRTEVELQQKRAGTSTKKDGAGAFYRLPDGGASGETAVYVPTDATLRPDHGCAYTVTSRPGKGDGESLSGDEVPLHGIRVRTDFKHSSSSGE